MTIRYAARSHVGLVRENNEDALFLDGVMLPPDLGKRPFSLDGYTEGPAVFAVCDGMGGEEAGEVASRLAVEALALCRDRLTGEGPLEEAVQDYVRRADHAIWLEGMKRMGTTLALAVLRKGKVCCYNLGDSRIYALRRGRFWQVTQDHTLAAERRRRGERDVRGGEHVLTRCIGIGPLQQAESCPPISGDCRLLICSDGLILPPGRIGEILQAKQGPSQAADALLRGALEAGGHDNVTLIVADVERPPLLRRLQRR